MDRKTFEELFRGAIRTRIEASDASGLNWTAHAYQLCVWPSDDKWVLLLSQYEPTAARNWEDIGYKPGPMSRLWCFDDLLTIVTWSSGDLSGIEYEDLEVYEAAKKHRIEQALLTAERDRVMMAERQENSDEH